MAPNMAANLSIEERERGGATVLKGDGAIFPACEPTLSGGGRVRVLEHPDSESDRRGFW